MKNNEAKVYLSRRNLLTLLSKLDRNVSEPGVSACTLIKNDFLHEKYPQSHQSIAVTAVEDDDYYSSRGAGVVHPADDPDTN